MTEKTPLMCPRCGGNISARVVTTRTLDFGNSDTGYVGLWAEGPRQYWEAPGGDDSSECSDTKCGDPDCEAAHNYDAQKNRELLMDFTTDKVFTYDWDYMEEYDEEIETVRKLYCAMYACDWEMTVTEQHRNHISLENVG